MPDALPLPTSYAAACAQVGEAQQALYANTTDLPPWPWASIQALCGPPLPGDLTVIGARPANGKTTVMLGLFDAFVQAGFPTLYIGAGSEGPPRDLRRQWAALRCNVPAHLVLENRWDLLPAGSQDRVYSELQRQATDDHHIGLFADLGERLTEAALVEAVKLARRTKDCRYILLDHIHRVRFTAAQALRGALSETTRWLRDMAARYEWSVIVAAQLHRASNVHGTLRDLIPPVMSDLKETGTLEEDAVVGLLLHRVKRVEATPQQVHAVSRGERPIGDVLEPDCMAVRIGKHRRRGHVMDHTAFLTVSASGRLTDRAAAWRTPILSDANDEGVPF